jgi:hypothetical protein
MSICCLYFIGIFECLSSDLRKLTTQDQERILFQMGYTKQEIKSIPRWDRVRLVMEMANSAKELGAAEDLLRFARTGRVNHASRLVEYRKSCREIWDKQVKALSNMSWEAPVDDDEDVSAL